MKFDSGKQEGISRGLARRPLRFALGASLAIHGLLLVMGAWQSPQPVAAARLLATLRSAPDLPVPPIAPPRHIVQREKPRPMAQAAVSSRREFKPAPTIFAPSPAPSIADAVPNSTAANAAPPAAASVTPLAETAPGPSIEAPTEAPTLSADGLRRYRLSLATQARRFKRYPAQALAAGWSGTAEIRLMVASDGQGEATLSRSSGYAVLDRAAQTMIEQSAQHTPVPEALRGKAFSVVLPVLFDINNGG
jgi:protein TonB